MQRFFLTLTLILMAIFALSLINCGGDGDEIEEPQSGTEVLSAPEEKPKDISQLTTDLTSEDFKTRFKAINKITDIGPGASDAVDILIGILRNDEKKLMRSEAADALGAIGAEAKKSIPILIESLKDEAWEVRRHAALALASFGADAKDARNALINMQETEEKGQVKEAIEQALAAMGEVSL